MLALAQTIITRLLQLINQKFMVIGNIWTYFR
jgi:hypothetical protein